MSAETFTTAIFLVTAVIAAGVLVNALFPVVYTMVGTFSSASHESDVQLRTDFKIITTTAIHGTPGKAYVWLKNIGSSRIAEGDIARSDVFCGAVGNFDHMRYVETDPASTAGDWSYNFDAEYDLNANFYWDPGETVKITAVSNTITSTGDIVYFQFALPSGIWRSTEFTAR